MHSPKPYWQFQGHALASRSSSAVPLYVPLAAVRVTAIHAWERPLTKDLRNKSATKLRLFITIHNQLCPPQPLGSSFLSSVSATFVTGAIKRASKEHLGTYHLPSSYQAFRTSLPSLLCFLHLRNLTFTSGPYLSDS